MEKGLKNHRKNHGKIMEKSWKNLEKSCKTLGKIIEKIIK